MIEEGYRASEHNNLTFSLDDWSPYLTNLKILFTLLFMTTLIVYFYSFSVPFYLDDYPSIVENPSIYTITKPEKIWGFYFPRFIAYLSFSLNYTLHGTETLGYHIVNFIIHFLAGLCVFWLSRLLLTATYNEGQSSQKNQRLYLYTIPFIAALIFLINPQQTQAVTYIVQRLSSLAALFYLAALVTYCYARLHKKSEFFILTLAFSMLAFFTKQNTATLPLAILLIEIIFFKPLSKANWKKALLIILPFTGLFIIIAYTVFDLSLEKLDALTRTSHTEHLTREEYFATQTLVIWHYIRQFFIPVDLHLDYDYPVQQSLFSVPVLLAMLAHAAVLLLAYSLRNKQPLIFFAIVFYYLAHLVESSFIPITDIVFEHRTYLPNTGLSILTAVLFYLFYQKTGCKKLSLSLLIFMMAWFAYFTIARNNEWTDPIAFYKNETELSPKKERVWADLGKYYLKEKKYPEALQSFGTALNLGKEGNTLNALPTTLLNTYFALLYTNQIDKASYFETLIPIDLLSTHDKAVFYYMQGNRLAKVSQYSEAVNSYLQALKINSNYLDAKANLAAAYMAQKDYSPAKNLLIEILAVNPSHKTALYYLKQLNER